MIQSNNNKPQLADFLLQFGIAIKQSIPTFLPNYGLIKISGIDAAIFLTLLFRLFINVTM